MKKASSKRHIILSAGGTGGHLFPALALAKELRDEVELLFVASHLSKNRFFDNSFSYREITAGPLPLSRPLKALSGLKNCAKGFFESCQILDHFHPCLVVGFGSFHTLPLLAAAVLKKIPILLHEQNAILGKVNRLFSAVATTTALTFPLQDKRYPKRLKLVEFPLRHHDFSNRQRAAAYFSLDPEKMTLLIFGGSQGAVRLNQVVIESLSTFTSPFQVLHFTGSKEMAEYARQQYLRRNILHCVKDFEVKMDMAWALTDVAITRAGAGTIAELIASETPAFLIPFPFATDQHQVHNAKYFTEVVRGGILRLEKEVTTSCVHTILNTLLSEQQVFKENIRCHKSEHKNKKLVDLVRDLLSRS